jgi:rod shape-determining protein MreB and related proteins
MFNFIPNLEKIHVPLLSYFQIYVDMGTSKTRIAIKDKGIVLSEPSVLGYNKKVREYIFFGREAKQIIGKVPDYITIEKPVVNGIIHNFDAEAALIDTFIEKSVYPYINRFLFIKPSLEVGAAVPSTATEIEQKAAEEVLYKIGVSRVSLYEKQLVTAIGCGFNVFLHQPIFLIDLGAGLIEISVISGGGIVTQKTLKTAGDHMNKLIYNYVYLKHAMVLGESTCEELKINLANFTGEEKTMAVRGKSLESGLPKSIKIKSADVKEALLPTMHQIVDAAKEVIEVSPPEIVDEIFKRGLILTGGLSQIAGIDTFFSKELNVQARCSEHKDNATINGLMRLGRRKEYMQRLKIQVP